MKTSAWALYTNICFGFGTSEGVNLPIHFLRPKQELPGPRNGQCHFRKLPIFSLLVPSVLTQAGALIAPLVDKAKVWYMPSVHKLEDRYSLF